MGTPGGRLLLRDLRLLGLLLRQLLVLPLPLFHGYGYILKKYHLNKWDQLSNNQPNIHHLNISSGR